MQSEPRRAIIATTALLTYGVIARSHYYAYVHWSEQEAPRVYVLHTISIASHVVSLYLCAVAAQKQLASATIVVANLCHNWLIHFWNTVLSTTSFMSRLTL